jgi:transposase-like protein
MSESNPEQKAAAKSDQWRDRLAEQERSGLSVKQFCQQQGVTEYSFYAWRKRLRNAGQVRFALVERGAQPAIGEFALELMLANGDRLRIGAGVDAKTLGTVLEVLRA